MAKPHMLADPPLAPAPEPRGWTGLSGCPSRSPTLRTESSETAGDRSAWTVRREPAQRGPRVTEADPATPSRQTGGVETTRLYRPVGPKELDLIRESDWRSFPPRLDWQPIFYPVLTEEYATAIARDWNTKASGAGYVTAFDVDSEYLGRFETHEVGGRELQEYWVPAEELHEFNEHIVGPIVVVSEWRGDPPVRVQTGQGRSSSDLEALPEP
jgi:hypothetical protein